MGPTDREVFEHHLAPGRREMHEALEQSRKEYAARPGDKSTVSNPFSFLFTSKPSKPKPPAHKTNAELQAEMQGPGRKQAHEELTRAHAQYDARKGEGPTNAEGFNGGTVMHETAAMTHRRDQIGAEAKPAASYYDSFRAMLGLSSDQARAEYDARGADKQTRAESFHLSQTTHKPGWQALEAPDPNRASEAQVAAYSKTQRAMLSETNARERAAWDARVDEEGFLESTQPEEFSFEARERERSLERPSAEPTEYAENGAALTRQAAYQRDLREAASKKNSEEHEAYHARLGLEPPTPVTADEDEVAQAFSYRPIRSKAAEYHEARAKVLAQPAISREEQQKRDRKQREETSAILQIESEKFRARMEAKRALDADNEDRE